MACTMTVDGPCRRTLEFRIDREVLHAEIEQQVREIARTSRFKGFRPGKAPLDLVRRTHGKALADEARRRIMGRAFAEALEEHRLQPVGDPELDLTGLSDDEGGPFTFSLGIEVAPEFELQLDERIPVTVALPAVGEALIEREVESLRRRAAALEDAPEGVLVGRNDVLEGTAAYEVGGQHIEGRHAVALVEHGVVDGIVVEGAADALVGKTVGGVVELPVTLPGHFKPAEHAGQDATLRFEITRHRLAVLPEPDDPAFLQRLGVSSGDELRQRLREGLQHQREQVLGELVDREVEKALLARHDFELPERLLGKSIDRRVHEIAHQLMEREGLSAEDGHQRAEEKRAEITGAARDGLRLAFILDRVAREHGLLASTADAEAQVATMAARENADPEALLAAARKEGWLGDVQEQLTRSRARQWLRNRAEVTETEPTATAGEGGSSGSAGASGEEGTR